MKRMCLTVLIMASIIISTCMVVKHLHNTPNPHTPVNTGSAGEGYETAVQRAFMDMAYSSLNIADRDYYSIESEYTGEHESSDGELCYSYLISAEYSDGKTHVITARAYYVPAAGKTLIYTSIMLDGKTLYYDEEKENRLRGTA